MQKLIAEWGFLPQPLDSRDRELALRVAARMRERKVVPEREKNDAIILAQTAIHGISLLCSSDTALDTTSPIDIAEVLIDFGIRPR